MSLENQQHHDDGTSISAAADLIRTINTAFAEINTNAINATKESDDARKNARVASEIARLFSSQPNGSSAVDSMPINLMERIPVFETPSTPIEFSNGFALAPSPSPPRPPDGGFCWIGTNNKTVDDFAENTTEKLQYGRRHHPVVASERLARAHIEDVLSITMELEKAKNALESEQMRHDETKSSLSQAKAKYAQAESQIEKLLNEMETNRENDARKIRELEEEIRISQYHARAAEEDAQLAMDIGKENVERRVETERWLEKALDEIRVLRLDKVRLQTLGNQGMQIDTNTIINTNRDEWETRRERQNVSPMHNISESPNSKPSRTLVAAGMEIAQRCMNQNGSNDQPISINEAIRTASELSRRLRNRLVSFEEDDRYFERHNGNDTPIASPSRRSSPRRDLASAVEALDVCRKTVDALKESGKRLHLTGRWWTGETDVILDEIHLETLARDYCTSVEVKILLVAIRFSALHRLVLTIACHIFFSRY